MYLEKNKLIAKKESYEKCNYSAYQNMPIDIDSNENKEDEN